MSWLELDDRILEHPKFIRAVKLAGSDVVHLWLGLRAYCGQLLTDGLIPEDMVSEVRGPKDARRRTAALGALIEVKLLDRVDSGVMMHDFLDWSSSRDDVLARRESARDRQRRSRGGSRAVTRDSEETSPSVTDPRARGSAPLPSDHHSAPLPSEPREQSARATGNGRASHWNAIEWCRRYGAAWVDRYGLPAYGQAGDSRGCSSLSEMLERLSVPDRLSAQAKAPEMFAEFLSRSDERTVERRHPFAFFVHEWGGLRAPRKPVEARGRSRSEGNVDVAKAFLAEGGT